MNFCAVAMQRLVKSLEFGLELGRMLGRMRVAVELSWPLQGLLHVYQSMQHNVVVICWTIELPEHDHNRRKTHIHELTLGYFLCIFPNRSIPFVQWCLCILRRAKGVGYQKHSLLPCICLLKGK